jgi:hypothetical protein
VSARVGYALGKAEAKARYVLAEKDAWPVRPPRTRAVLPLMEVSSSCDEFTASVGNEHMTPKRPFFAISDRFLAVIPAARAVPPMRPSAAAASVVRG